MTRGVVDDLGIDLVDAAEDRQARPLSGPREVEADPRVALLRRAARLSAAVGMVVVVLLYRFGAPGDGARPVGDQVVLPLR